MPSNINSCKTDDNTIALLGGYLESLLSVKRLYLGLSQTYITNDQLKDILGHVPNVELEFFYLGLMRAKAITTDVVPYLAEWILKTKTKSIKLNCHMIANWDQNVKATIINAINENEYIQEALYGFDKVKNLM